ncbi:MAG: hypothetical protein ACXVBE_09425, partial [Bdellovibrionota bacterium]
RDELTHNLLHALSVFSSYVLTLNQTPDLHSANFALRGLDALWFFQRLTNFLINKLSRSIWQPIVKAVQIAI